MDSILLFKEDLDQYNTSELNVLQQYFDLPAANRDDMAWMLAIYQAENSHQGKMTGVSERKRANMRRHRGTMNGGKEGLTSWAAESLWSGVSDTAESVAGAMTDYWYPPPEGATTCRDVRENFDSLVASDRHMGRFFALIVEASKPISYRNMSPEGIEEVLEQRVKLLDMTRNAKAALDIIPTKYPSYQSSKKQQFVFVQQRWKDLEYYLFNMFPGGTCKGRETDLTCSLCTYFLAALDAVPIDSMEHFIELYDFYTDHPTSELWDVTEAERARLRKTIEDIKIDKTLIKVW